MARSSRVVCRRTYKVREQSTMRREDAMGIALSAQGMIGTMLASLYRARNGQSEDCPFYSAGLIYKWANVYMFGYQNYTGHQLTNEINAQGGAITAHYCTAHHNDIIAAHDVMGWPSLGPCIGSVCYDAIGSVCYCTWHHMVCALSLEPSRTFFKERSGISDWSRSGEGHVRVVEHVINHMHGHVRDHVGDTWYVSWSRDLLVIVANTVCQVSPL